MTAKKTTRERFGKMPTGSLLTIQFPDDRTMKAFMAVNKNLEIVSKEGVLGQPLATHVVCRIKGRGKDD